MFARLGRLVAHHPWRVIGVWVVLAVLVVALSPGLPTTSQESDALPKDADSVKALALQQQAFPGQATPGLVAVFERTDGARMTAADREAVAHAAGSLRGVDGVRGVGAPAPSPKGLVDIVSVQMPELTQSGQDALFDDVDTIRDRLDAGVRGSDLRVSSTGQVAQAADAQESAGSSEAITLLGTVGLIIVLLALIFRSPIIALMPIVVIGIVSSVANGLIADVVRLFGLEADTSVNSLLIVVLFGVGTDYILFLLFRYRERLRLGEEPREAMVSAVSRVGEAIASAAFVVIIAFLALLLSSVGFLRSLGPSLAIAVFVTLIAGITLVPAVVSLLGTKVFWPSKSFRTEPKGARFAAVGESLGRHPRRFVAGSGLVLVVLAVGVIGFSPSFDLTSGSLPDSADSQIATRALERDLPPGATDPTQVYVQATAGRLDRAALRDYAARIGRVEGVGAAATPQLNADGRVARIDVTLRAAPESDSALSTVDGPLRSTAAEAVPAGATALVGGTTAVYVDLRAGINRDYTVVFPVAALLIMLVLGLLLRSIVAPVYLMASVALGFLATLGATSVLFTNIGSESGLVFLLPVIMYMFVVAVGTDYNILMTARLREEAREGASPRVAVATAIRFAGPTIAAAGVILAGSFAALLLAGNSFLSQIGFAVAFGIAVSAFVMAMFFAPAITALLGHRAWWPGHQDAAIGPPQDEDATSRELTAR